MLPDEPRGTTRSPLRVSLLSRPSLGAKHKHVVDQVSVLASRSQVLHLGGRHGLLLLICRLRLGLLELLLVLLKDALQLRLRPAIAVSAHPAAPDAQHRPHRHTTRA